jgi:hypothetical protein
LRFLDLRVIELHHAATFGAQQMIVVSMPKRVLVFLGTVVLARIPCKPCILKQLHRPENRGLTDRWIEPSGRSQNIVGRQMALVFQEGLEHFFPWRRHFESTFPQISTKDFVFGLSAVHCS